ncbi:MAG: hypothetical protein IPK16_28690 [Anaerolineales bacterium]|nr:hypothetical protein [Anaerolineales bacterium]
MWVRRDRRYTPTHLPRWNSRAVDRGGASLQTNDQRKRVRPYGLAPDIGSIELNYLMLPDLRKTP